MFEGFDILIPAFVLCLLMILTHSYFGLHVLARGIIFVDLALAQVAALGISVAFLLGKESHGIESQLYAFTATLIISFAFALLRKIPEKVSREVIIGCVYVVSTALSIVILSQSSQGMEELKSILNGNILWVSWQEIAVVAGAYLLVSLLHLTYLTQFKKLSFDTEIGKDNERDGHKEQAEKMETPSFIWEFLFFASFAIVITLAVNIAGVLLVFAFLIIPAFSASLLQKQFSSQFIKQLLLAWGLGITGCLIGLAIAFNADLPVGATIVSFFGLLPVFAAMVSMLKKQR
ncbi:MAG: metal ABC transporter permease [Gammaproteobacteria bacterium]|nr:metal ABC transporter permease [Gammaproteobacteria bacterium]